MRLNTRTELATDRVNRDHMPSAAELTGPVGPADVGGGDDDGSNSNDDYDRFRSDVSMWLELDTSIRAMQAGIRERREAKLKLTKRIAAFMARNEIEDMSTRAGRLRFQVECVRAPLSHKTIRDRISDFYSSSPDAASELSGAVFGNRQRSERVAIRRVL